MKKLFTTLLFVHVAITAYCQATAIQPRVDERTELLSIVFRLAGSGEYVNNNLAGYARDIDNYFEPFKNSGLIMLAHKLNLMNGVSFDAVMSMAVNIEIRDGIRFKENLSEQSLDKRWGKESGKKFVKLLNGFYKESKFHEFFTDHQNLYNIAENNFSKLISQVDFNWFQSFYGGKPFEGFNLVISLTNGGSNYGIKAQFNDGREEDYAIIGTWKTNFLGQPVYSNSNIATIIHEYNHSFCNPLVDSYYSEMEPQAEKFYKQVSTILRRQAYASAKTMTYEILVRACVIKYFQRNKLDQDSLRRMILKEKTNGFLWIEELVNSLTVYEKNRDKYPILREYMPEIVKTQNGLSPKDIKKEIDIK